MATVLETLKGISAYPIPFRTLLEVVDRRGVNMLQEATQEVLTSSDYQLAKADLLLWLSLAPNISQGGQSYSLSDEQRKQLRAQAQSFYNACGEGSTIVKPTYGYKGSRL